MPPPPPPSEYIAKTMTNIVHTYLHNAIEVLSTKFGFDKTKAYESLNEHLVFEHNTAHDDFSEHITSEHITSEHITSEHITSDSITTEPGYREVETPTASTPPTIFGVGVVNVSEYDTKCSLENYLFDCLRDYHIPPPQKWREYEFIPLKLIHIHTIPVSIKINAYTLKSDIKSVSAPIKINQITLAPYINPDTLLKEEPKYIVEQLLMPVKIKDDTTLDALKNLSEEMIRFQYDVEGKRYFKSKNIVYKFEIKQYGTWNKDKCKVEHEPTEEFGHMFDRRNNVIQCLYAIDGDNYDRYELEFIVENGVVYLKADDNIVYNFKAYKIGGALPSAGYISGYDVDSVFRLRIYNN